MLRVNEILKRFHTPNWLFFLLLVVLILRIPSFFEPYSYGDEMIYLTLGEAIRQGIPLYKGIHDNKPPLLYIMAGIAGNLFWFKAILAIWHLITVYLFWRLTEALFPKKTRGQIVATSIFAILTTIPLLEGNIVNAELFMIGPIILAFLLLLTKTLNFQNLFLAGSLFSIAALFKVPAAFDLPTIIFLWLIGMKRLEFKGVKQILLNTFYLASGFIIPIALTFIWFYLKGSLKEYAIAAFLQNFGYLSSWRPDQIQQSFIVKNMPLLQRAGVISAGLTLLYWKKKVLSKNFIFAAIWLLLSLFAVTLSERPYPHYLIQSAAPLALLLAIFFTNKTKEQVFTLIPITLAIVVPVYFKFWYYPTFPYYSRFVKLATGQISNEVYLSSFGEHVPRNYKVSDFISFVTQKGDKIFVWGPDSSTIYALTRRFPPGKFVADYHIKDFSRPTETITKLTSNLPNFIVILKGAESFPELEFLIKRNYGVVQDFDGTEIWKLLSPRVRQLIS